VVSSDTRRVIQGSERGTVGRLMTRFYHLGMTHLTFGPRRTTTG